MVHLGNNIARLRGFRRLTQKEIAALLNLTQQDYSKIETRPDIDDALLERIAAVMDFPVELIRELEHSSIQTVHNSGSISDSIFYQNNPVEKVTELYERLLKEKETIIALQKQALEAALIRSSS